jgi:hypothetical protein
MVPPGHAHLLHRRQQLVRQALGPFGRAAIQQHGEFVAAQAPHRIALAHPVLQDAGHRLQHGVAGQVALGVVDGLEMVQVDDQQGGRPARLGRHETVQPGQEGRAVEQAGQRVVAGRPFQFMAGLHLLRDVAERQHHAGVQLVHAHRLACSWPQNTVPWRRRKRCSPT